MQLLMEIANLCRACQVVVQSEEIVELHKISITPGLLTRACLMKACCSIFEEETFK